MGHEVIAEDQQSSSDVVEFEQLKTFSDREHFVALGCDKDYELKCELLIFFSFKGRDILRIFDDQVWEAVSKGSNQLRVGNLEILNVVHDQRRIGRQHRVLSRRREQSRNK